MSSFAAQPNIDVIQDDLPTRHDVNPDAALAIVREFVGPRLVDLDETLYLRNSTEDFIDCAAPGVLALVLLRVLDIVKPWRWTGGELTRDVWRVRTICVFFPWVMRNWNRRVTLLASQHANISLIAALQHSVQPTIIATVGFRFIVKPLVAALGFQDAQLIASQSFEDRRRGKLYLAQVALPEETVRNSLVITDSLQDLPLLDVCMRPLRTLWPEARYVPALRRVYLPGQYLTQVKRPGERYIIRGILQEDFAFWILASIALATHPLNLIVGLSFLLLSFWTIYERGYVDNDQVAAAFEAQPKLTAAFADAPVAIPAFQPWVWAIASGVIGVGVLRWPEAPSLADAGAWLAVLVGTHAWFKLYNRFDKTTRVWLFPGLQLARTAGFCVLVPIAPIGAMALASHVMARWLPYYIYRYGGKNWPDAPFPISRLLFFGIAMLFMVVSNGVSVVLNWTAVALLLWNLFRARKDLRIAFSKAHRIDRPATSSRP